MSEQKRELRSRLEDLMSKCRIRIDEGLYSRGLDALREAKELDPKNIYLIALERQVKSLVGEGFKKTLTPKDRKDILSSIPEIMRRAIDDTEKREGQLQQQSDKPDLDVEELRARERQRAIKRQKESYVQLAEEYIDRGDYERALDEIRRIYIIDPENMIARDLETKISQLVRMHQPEIEIQQPRKRKLWFPTGKILPTTLALLFIFNVTLLYTKLLKPITENYLTADTQALYIDGVKKSGITAANFSALAAAGWSRLLPELFNSEQFADEDTASLSVYAAHIVEESEPTVEYEDADTFRSIELAAYVLGPEPETESKIDDAVSNIEIAQDIPTSDVLNSVTEIIGLKQIQKAGGDQMGEVSVESAADVIHLELPEYPVDALRDGIEGVVVVRVVLDNNGKPILITIVRSDHPLLDIPAFESARRSVYRHSPAVRDNLNQGIDVLYRFRLVSGEQIAAGGAS
jgi:TonB family protein